MPPPLGPNDAAQAGAEPLGENDAAQDTLPPSTPNDAAQEPTGACNCCGGSPLCTRSEDIGCASPWPQMIQFALSTITEAPDASASGDFTCCSFSPRGPADCLNKTWRIDYLLPGVPPGDLCAAPYQFSCQEYRTFEGTEAYDSVTAFVSVVFQYSTDGGPHVDVTLVIGAGFTSTNVGPLGYECGDDRVYKKTYPLDSFPCDGPWVLDLDPTSYTPGPGGPGDMLGGWPDTLTLTGSSGPATTGCCEFPVVDADLCAANTEGATFNCVLGTGCIDPGDGSGFYTGVNALELCQSACIQTFDCTGDPVYECVDHGGPGGAYPNRIACEEACVPPSEGDTRPSCCGVGVTGPSQLIAIIGPTPDPGGCQCLNLGPTIVWAPGENAYTASFVAGCGAGGAPVFVKVSLFCVPTEGGGEWWFQIECESSIVALFRVDHAAGSTYDGSGTVLEAPDHCVFCTPGTPISVLITPVGDPETQPGLCEGGGGGPP